MNYIHTKKIIVDLKVLSVVGLQALPVVEAAPAVEAVEKVLVTKEAVRNITAVVLRLRSKVH